MLIAPVDHQFSVIAEHGDADHYLILPEFAQRQRGRAAPTEMPPDTAPKLEFVCFDGCPAT